jgi:hypothetical protein
MLCLLVIASLPTCSTYQYRICVVRRPLGRWNFKIGILSHSALFIRDMSDGQGVYIIQKMNTGFDYYQTSTWVPQMCVKRATDDCNWEFQCSRECKWVSLKCTTINQSSSVADMLAIFQSYYYKERYDVAFKNCHEYAERMYSLFAY